MSAERTSSRLLRAYPLAWRRRYGQELENLIVEASQGGRVGWRTRFDVLLAGGRERLRAAAGGPGGSPSERVKSSLIQVLWAWALFVVAGLLLQRFSEHWQSTTPNDVQSVPDLALTVLVVAAICGTALVLIGAAVMIPAFFADLRERGAAPLRRQLIWPAVLTAITAAATVAIVAWAGGLGAAEREGGNSAYAVGFVLWALLTCGCLALWTAAAADIARRLSPPAVVLRAQCWLSAALAIAMATVTGALIAWWVSLASVSHSFLASSAPGAAGSTVPAQLVAAAALMLSATLLAAAGSRRALRGLPAGLT